MTGFGTRFSIGRPMALLVAILILLNAPAARIAAAETHQKKSSSGHFESEFFLAVGGFFPQIDSTFSLAPSSGGSGQDISVEDELGLDGSTSSVWINFNWRFLPRHQLTAAWFQLDRSGSSGASDEFKVGDTTVFVGASLTSKIDLNLGRLTYGYSIIRDERFDLSLLIGAHIVTVKGTVTASGSIAVNGVPAAGGTSTESSSTYTIPLPHVGASIGYKISPKWTAQFDVLLFALEFDNYRGSLFQADATVGYQVTKHLGLGAGLTYFNMNVQSQSARAAAGFDFEFYGPSVFAYTTF